MVDFSSSDRRSYICWTWRVTSLIALASAVVVGCDMADSQWRNDVCSPNRGSLALNSSSCSLVRQRQKGGKFASGTLQDGNNFMNSCPWVYARSCQNRDSLRLQSGTTF